MTDAAIEIRGLSKSYNGSDALSDIDLTIFKGQFFGLLGPNGAGKSTTINILTGLVRKNKGEITVFGKDIENDFRFTRSQIGTAQQELSVDWFFPIEKLLYYQAGYYGISKNMAKDRIHDLLNRLGLWEKRGSRLRQLSGGMKRRFQLAKALVHDPNIIILDEPTAGVDVELRHELWDYLRHLHKNGKTILLTTHYIEEAELLCEYVSIIHNGKVISEGTPSGLINDLGQAGITIQLKDWSEKLTKVLESYTYTRSKNHLHFSIQDTEIEMPKIISLIANNGCHIQRVKSEKSSLEDVFLNLTGRGIND